MFQDFCMMADKLQKTSVAGAKQSPVKRTSIRQPHPRYELTSPPGETLSHAYERDGRPKPRIEKSAIGVIK